MAELLANELVLAVVLLLQIGVGILVRRLEYSVREVHVAVNSNLSEAQDKLNQALVSIEKLEEKLRRDDGGDNPSGTS